MYYELTEEETQFIISCIQTSKYLLDEKNEKIIESIVSKF
jgi:hypothetical protein